MAYAMVYIMRSYVDADSIQNYKSITFKSILDKAKDKDFSVNSDENIINTKESVTEKSKWSTIKELIEALSEKRKDLTTEILRHYLFRNAKKACIEVLKIGGTDLNKIIDEVFQMNQEQLLLTFKAYDFFDNPERISFNQSDSNFTSIGNRKYNEIWSSPVKFVQWPKYYDDFKNEVWDYISESSVRIDLKIAEEKFINKYLPENLSSPQAQFLRKWCLARANIFQIDFDDDLNSEKNRNFIKNGLKLFNAAFETGKYYAGRNLPEFMEDIISTYCYFLLLEKKPKMAERFEKTGLLPKLTMKKRTDVLKNTQDDFSVESSIASDAKRYWGFAYSLGLVSEPCQKTYLCHFNHIQNFWQNFKPFKFNKNTAAVKFATDEQIATEGTVLIDLKDEERKIYDNYLDLNSPTYREFICGRYLSKMSFMIIKEQYERILVFLKIHDNAENRKADSAFIRFITTTDENGATPLIRALYEYKCIRRGWARQIRTSRAEYFKECLRTCYDSLYTLHDKVGLSLSIQDAACRDCLKKISNAIEDFSRNSAEQDEAQTDFNELRILILKLIDLYPVKELSYETINIDNEYCVSALQLAIDSFDVELVKAIVEKDSDLCKKFVSYECVDLLQYVIRLMATLADDEEKAKTKEAKLPSVPKRKLPWAGITLNGKKYNEEMGINELIDNPIIIEDPKGYFLGSCHQLIEYLAEKTAKVKQIPVDTLYYLVDCGNYSDIPKMMDMLIKNGADVAGINMENKEFDVPVFSLIGRCVSVKNWGALEHLLTNHADKLKPEINKIFFGWEKENPTELCYSTDFYYFVCKFAQSILFPSKYSNDKDFENSCGSLFAEFLTLFRNAGADFFKENNKGDSVYSVLLRRLEDKKWPENAIPDGFLETIQPKLNVVFEGMYSENYEEYKRIESKAQNGDAEAQIEIGNIYEQNQKFSAAVFWYKRAAESGNPVAMCYLGSFYTLGRGVQKNNDKAFYWYKKSADTGDKIGLYYLGLCYERGVGIKQNFKEAFNYYKKSAELDYEDAFISLANLYFKGVGTEKNLQEAEKWYKKAASNENPIA